MSEIVVALLQFLSLFETDIPSFTKPDSLADLSNGEILSRFLAYLEPSHFDVDLSGDSSEAIQNLLVSLETFLTQNLGKEVDLTFIRIEKIARDKDEGEIMKLLELVLLCAINSEQKESVVNNIMAMSDGDQAQLMFVINEVTNQISNAGVTGRPSIDSSEIDELATSIDDSTVQSRRLGQDNFSSSRIKELEESLRQMEISKEELQIRMTSLERDKKESNKRESELKRQIDELLKSKENEIAEARKEAMEVEGARQMEMKKFELNGLNRIINEWEHKTNELKIDLKKLQESNNSLQREKLSANEMNDELKGKLVELKDELQIATVKADQNVQLEAKLTRLQQRLDQAGDVKAQVEYAEEQAQKSLDKIIALEAQIKEIPALKNSLAKYKDQVVAAQQKAMDSSLQLEQKDSELRELKEEAASRRSETRSLQDELKSARMEIESIKLKSEGANGGDFESLNGISSKEQINRLEFELKQLKSELESKGDNSELQNDLDIARTMAESNQNKYLEAARKISALESQMRKQENSAAAVSQSSASEAEVEKLRKDLQAAQDSVAVLRRQTAGAATFGGSSIPGLLAAQAALSSSQTIDTSTAASKLDALTIRNKKLETFVKHTQKKLKLFEEMNTKATSELGVLKDSNRQLKAAVQERDKELLEKEKMRLDDMTTSNRERRLMSSAFYALGMDYQISLITGKSAGRNANEKSSQRSWLSQQRTARGTEN